VQLLIHSTLHCLVFVATSLCIRVAILVLAVASGASSQVSHAQNPLTAFYPVVFSFGGVGYTGKVTVASAYWMVSEANWDGKFTSKGRRIEHCDNKSTDFPVWASIPSGGGFIIGAAQVNDHWDYYYNAPAYAKMDATATLSCNCHGHAFGKGYWINWDDGANRVAVDDFSVTTAKCGVNHAHKFPGIDHSEKLLECCTNGSVPDTIRRKSEKTNTSGTYLWPVLDCPSNLATSGVTYKPN
jgi:hypothetical protein